MKASKPNGIVEWLIFLPALCTLDLILSPEARYSDRFFMAFFNPSKQM
jgi:hypothetical protein